MLEVLGVPGVVGVLGVVEDVGAADDIELAGSVAREPMSSSTTGAFANGSCVFPLCRERCGTVECVSVTTGTVCFAPAACLACRVAGDGAFFSAGSAGSGWNLGTRRSGAATLGSVSDGSGSTGAETPACRRARAIGAAYRDTRTTSPRAAHRYLTRLNRSATSPYGLAAATDA